MTSGELVTQAVKVRMVRRQMNQLDLSKASGVSPGQLSRYLTGRREWPIRILDKIAKPLGWKDGLDVFIAAEQEKKMPADDTAGEETRKDQNHGFQHQ